MSNWESKIFNNPTRPVREILGLLLLIASMLLWLWPELPTADRAAYFEFADENSFGIFPNVLNVISNLPFIWIGILGGYFVHKNSMKSLRSLKVFCYWLAGASIATGLGSSCFHLHPNPSSLTWDRLPMAIGFAAIAALIIADRIDLSLGRVSSWILIPLGMFSVLGLHVGWIDLRPYIFVQYGTLIFVLLLVLLKPPQKIPNSVWWAGVGLYVVAKIFELADKLVYDFTGLISGHSLKHLFAALAVYKIVSIFKEAKL